MKKQTQEKQRKLVIKAEKLRDLRPEEQQMVEGGALMPPAGGGCIRPTFNSSGDANG